MTRDQGLLFFSSYKACTMHCTRGKIWLFLYGACGMWIHNVDSLQASTISTASKGQKSSQAGCVQLLDFGRIRFDPAPWCHYNHQCPSPPTTFDPALQQPVSTHNSPTLLPSQLPRHFCLHIFSIASVRRGTCLGCMQLLDIGDLGILI